MGCTSSKTSAIEELNQIIKQVMQENALLEKERDKLKTMNEDRPEEEKDTLQGLRIMQTELEKEIRDLKEIMTDLLPQPTQDSDTYLSVKNGVERITEVQRDLEEKSEKIREIIAKREQIKLEHKSLEYLIAETEKQIQELENAIEVQEETLRNHEDLEEKIQEHEKEKSILIEELRDIVYPDIGYN
jgi:septation ring formation regulator